MTNHPADTQDILSTAAGTLAEGASKGAQEWSGGYRKVVDAIIRGTCGGDWKPATFHLAEVDALCIPDLVSLLPASPKKTPAWSRILDLKKARPGLFARRLHSWDKRIDLYDEDDGLFQSWTTAKILDGMAASGLWPTTIREHNGVKYLHGAY